jgi:hypothetical protein
LGPQWFFVYDVVQSLRRPYRALLQVRLRQPVR